MQNGKINLATESGNQEQLIKDFSREYVKLNTFNICIDCEVSLEETAFFL